MTLYNANSWLLERGSISLAPNRLGHQSSWEPSLGNVWVSPEGSLGGNCCRWDRGPRGGRPAKPGTLLGLWWAGDEDEAVVIRSAPRDRMRGRRLDPHGDRRCAFRGGSRPGPSPAIAYSAGCPVRCQERRLHRVRHTICWWTLFYYLCSLYL